MAGRGGLAVHDLSGIKTIRPSALLEGVRDSYIWPGLARLQDAVAFNPYSSTAAQDATRQITGPPAQYREPINRVLHGVGQDAPLIAATAPLGGMASAARAGLGGLAGSAVGHTLKERGHGGLSQFLGDTGTDMLVSMAMPAVIPAAIGREVVESVSERSAKEGAERASRVPTQFEINHQIAQKNAALPVSEGGLGLPADNTAMQRANAMGFEDYYHGTERADRLGEGKSFNPKRATSGPMPFGTSDPEIASSYAANKADTSRIASDTGEMEHYFQVSPKQLGLRGTRPYSVEQSFYKLSPEKRAEITENYYRVGFKDVDNGMDEIVLHPPGVDGSIASRDHLDYVLKREAMGNPLTAMRILWGESGTLFDDPSRLEDVFKASGYPHSISQGNAPWTSANGVFVGKVRMDNPLDTSDIQTINNDVIPALERAFKRDRSRLKPGADQWDKNSRFTPKEWVEQLKQDSAQGVNSFVWTSIPDKVTAELKRLGFDSIRDVSGKMGGSEADVLIPFSPNQVRSRFAAFDPKKKNIADLLAGFSLPIGAAELRDRKDNDRKGRGGLSR